MPRLNVGRSVDVEANLARRIAYERKQRGQSLEALAEAMTKAGCAINGSSIYKIESSGRRISVDELATLARIWDQPSVDALLIPMELLEQRRAQELVAKLRSTEESAEALSADYFEIGVELLGLIREDRDLYDYVMNHHKASGQSGGRWAARDQGDVETYEEVVRLRALKATEEFRSAILRAADLWCDGRDGKIDPDKQVALERELAEGSRDIGLIEAGEALSDDDHDQDGDT